MRSAICFYGQPRHIHRSWDALRLDVIEPNNADRYFHFWNTHPDETNPWSKEEDVKWLIPTEQSLVDLIQPVRYELEPQVNFDISPYPKAQCPVFNLLSFTYSLKKSHLLYDTSDYDVIIHCRSDLQFIKQTLIKEVADNTIYIEHRGTSGDQFAYGTPRVMRIFSSCYDYFDDLYKQVGYVHGETFFRTLMENHGVRIVPCERNFKINRFYE